MNINPFAARSETLQKEIALREAADAAQLIPLQNNVTSTTQKIDELTQSICDYKAFDADSTHFALCIALREQDALQSTIDGIHPLIEKARIEEKSADSTLHRYSWYQFFSAGYSAAKKETQERTKILNQLTTRRTDLKSNLNKKLESVLKLQAALEHHRTFDSLEAEATIRALELQLPLLKIQWMKVRAEQERVMSKLVSGCMKVLLLKEKLDDELSVPMSEFKKLEVRQSQLNQDIARAESFERELSSESNGYRRKQIHENCNSVFGESKPSRVVGAKRRELESVERNAKKLQGRMEEIARRATLIIKTLLLDGNNLCYQQKNFIGIGALKAIAKKLSEGYGVTIVFDASIRRLLQMRDQDISAHFGDRVNVHIVAAGIKADETLLDSASAPDAYVISNDRFEDFPEKPVVRERRLIRHEILNGNIYIHDLKIEEQYPLRDSQ